MGSFFRISVLMKNVFLAMLIILSVNSFVMSQTNQTDSKGRKQGEWIKYYPNSKHIEYKGSFLDDKPNGTFFYYFYDGTTKMVADHNAKTGRSAVYTYYDDKKVKSFGIYYNMKKDSVWTYYSNTGIVSKRESYKGDLLDGTSYSYYVNDMSPKNPKVVEEEIYVKGKLEGIAKKYFRDGSLQETRTYKNDKLNGAFETYEPGGVKSSTSNFVNNLRHGISTVYLGNGKKELSYFVKGEKVKESDYKEYMKTGKMPNR